MRVFQSTLLLGATLLTAACASESVAPPTLASTAQVASSDLAETAAAQAVAEVAVVANVSLPSDENRRICRETEVTGSRFGRRICRTQREWDILEGREAKAATEMIRNTQENSLIVPESGNTTGFGTPAAVFQ